MLQHESAMHHHVFIARNTKDPKEAQAHRLAADAHNAAYSAHKAGDKNAATKSAAADRVTAKAEAATSAKRDKKPEGEKGALQTGAKGGQFYTTAKGTKIYVK
jgi:hypothetical protein